MDSGRNQCHVSSLVISSTDKDIITKCTFTTIGGTIDYYRGDLYCQSRNIDLKIAKNSNKSLKFSFVKYVYSLCFGKHFKHGLMNDF